MDSMVKVRVKALEIAASLNDVSAENVIDVAEKISKYIKRNADIPEYVGAEEFVSNMMEQAMAYMKEESSKKPPMPDFDEFLAKHTNCRCDK